jgi:hypothetical protein
VEVVTMHALEGPAGGLRVLDGGAVVLGTAVASVHIRGVLRDDLAGPGWALAWGAFLWIALTASGPFLFATRHLARRPAGRPRVGDWLWALLGLPWVATALIRATGPGSRVPHDDLFAASVGVGLGVACFIALTVVWRSWVAVNPAQAARASSGPWTNRVGLALAVAWPIQCGVGMVVIG